MLKRLPFLLSLFLLVGSLSLRATVTMKKLNPTTVEVYKDGQLLTLDFYGPNIVRLFLDPKGGIVRDPEATPPAKILVDQPRRDVGTFTVTPPSNTPFYRIETASIALLVDSNTGRISVADHNKGQLVTNASISFNEKGYATMELTADEQENFYGGGVQNGRFAHKGNIIAIENTNNWIDGGVASPTPFYWSTAGYGILWNTFRLGKYDFAATEPGKVRLMHCR